MSNSSKTIAGSNVSSSSESPELPALDPKDINIVLMGETGVGKSTFINAFATYLNYPSLEDAMVSSNIPCVIPSKFTITDEDFEERIVTFGEDDNECQTPGASSTQSTRSYRFPLGNRYVRLIDTPGVGDTRGIVKDEENLDKLLQTLAQLEFVHAFCILLKPNNAKLTVLFQYCIKQLLSHLDKSASRNIVFVFTNSRSTFYKPGDSVVPVKEILKSIKVSSNVDIPFGKKNVFCMDNEAFRFLLANKNGINFTETEKKDFALSWEKSLQVCFDMICYVAELEPPKVRNAVSINEARRLILNLSSPLALVAKNLEDNLSIIEKHQIRLANNKKTLNELKQLLHIDMVRIKVVEIDHPKTVCTDNNCTDIHIIEGCKYINYKQVCHKYCNLKNVPKQIVGCPELKKCWAMNEESNDPLCRFCNHSFSLHQHNYVDTIPYKSREIDKKIDANIKEVGITISAMIAALNNRRTSLKTEKDTVQKSVAKFAHFLSHNAITPYNDTYQEYIEYLVFNEKRVGQKSDKNLIRCYEDLIRVHQEHTKILDEQLKLAEKKTRDAIVITAQDIMNLVQELYRLDFSGKVIQDFHEKQQKARQSETLLHTEKKRGRTALVPSPRLGLQQFIPINSIQE